MLLVEATINTSSYTPIGGLQFRLA